MFQMRWAIVPACLTFGPLFFVMGVIGDVQLCLLGAIMTIAGLGILLHGIFTRQLPSPPPSQEYLSGVIYGIGIGCLIAAAFVQDLSADWLMYVGFAIVIAGSFLRPRSETRSKPSRGTA
jgi:hypothetical protein